MLIMDLNNSPINISKCVKPKNKDKKILINPSHLIRLLYHLILTFIFSDV